MLEVLTHIFNVLVALWGLVGVVSMTRPSFYLDLEIMLDAVEYPEQKRNRLYMLLRLIVSFQFLAAVGHILYFMI